MFKIVNAVLLVLLATPLLAQKFTLSGNVQDSKDQKALVGVTVKLTDQGATTITDQFGQFEFRNLSAGNYTIVLTSIGFEEKSETVNVTQDTKVAIPLKESVVLTDEVVVLATRADDKTPTTFTNVSKKEIKDQNFGQDLPFLLNWTPSVVATSDAGTGIGYTGLRIRGSDATRINVTINGIPYNDSESQGTFWVDVPDVASSTQSIQIQRGVGTSTNGAGAFGGSVNVQTLSLNPQPYANVIAAAGSFNSQRYTLQSGTGLINSHWAFDAKVSKIKSDGYVERATADLSSYYISGGYYNDKTIVKAIAFGGQEETYQAWYGVDDATLKTNRRFNYAGAIYDADYNVVKYYDDQVDHYNQDHLQLHWTQFLTENWNLNLSLHHTYGRGYYEEYQQGVMFSDMNLPNIIIGDSTLESSDMVVRKWLNNKFYGATFSLNYNKKKTNLIIGGAWNQYGHAKHYGEIIWAQYAGSISPKQHFYDGKSEKNDFNMYAKWNYSLTESLQAFVDLQYRDVIYTTDGVTSDQRMYSIDEHFGFVNPKAGVSYASSSADLFYMSYAVANREPNRTDFVDGEIKPKPEHLGNFELGWRRKKSNYNLELVGYLMNYTDQLVLTGALDDVGNPIRANVGKSYRTGLEALAGVRFSSRWTWQGNLTYSINKNKNYVFTDEDGETTKKDTDIILSPRLIGGSQLTWSAFKGFQITWQSKFVGDQYLDNTQRNDLMLDAYWIQDLRLGYVVPLKHVKSLGVSFLLNNLTDEMYASNGAVYDSIPYYYPQAGRNFMAMLTLSF